MRVWLHHINICGDNVSALDDFYRNVMLLHDDDPKNLPPINDDKNLVGEVSFVTDGAVQLHLTPKDITNSFRSGHIVNPLVTGHVAYRTDDIQAFKNHLEQQKIPYSDWGSDAVKGWHQIFFYDPIGTVIEVHQIIE